MGRGSSRVWAAECGQQAECGAWCRRGVGAGVAGGAWSSRVWAGVAEWGGSRVCGVVLFSRVWGVE